jgi:glucan phosphorylase
VALPAVATDNDWYQALAHTVRDRMLSRWITTAQTCKKEQVRTVCYFSAEFLLGPHLCINLLNLGIRDNVKTAIEELGLNLDRLLEKEPGLGNGGLDAWLPVISIPLRHAKYRPSATASVMNSVSSTSESRMAGRSR